MKKVLCIIMTILMLAVTPTNAYAAGSSRMITIAPSLSFEDLVATCGVSITANYYDDVIRAVIRLCYEGERIRVWYASGEGYLMFERDYDISDYGNGTYEITVDFTINNVAYERVSMERVYQQAGN